MLACCVPAFAHAIPNRQTCGKKGITDDEREYIDDAY